MARKGGQKQGGREGFQIFLLLYNVQYNIREKVNANTTRDTNSPFHPAVITIKRKRTCVTVKYTANCFVSAHFCTKEKYSENGSRFQTSTENDCYMRLSGNIYFHN